MANMVLPTVNNAAADTNSVPAPVASGPTNSAAPMVPAPEVLGGTSTLGTTGTASAISPAATPPESAAQQSPGEPGAGTVNVTSGAADPAPSFASEASLAPQPIAGWQAADFTGVGQSDLWGPAPNAAWSAELGVSAPAPDYSVVGDTPSADTFIGDTSMGDTLWYYASAGNTDDWQLASDQSTTGADFGGQSPGAAGSVVAGSGAGAADWFTA